MLHANALRLSVYPSQLNVLTFDGYGADVIKTFGMSPDAFAQMALQLAVFKMTGETTPPVVSYFPPILCFNKACVFAY